MGSARGAAGAAVQREGGHLLLRRPHVGAVCRRSTHRPPAEKAQVCNATSAVSASSPMLAIAATNAQGSASKSRSVGKTCSWSIALFLPHIICICSRGYECQHKGQCLDIRCWLCAGYQRRHRSRLRTSCCNAWIQTLLSGHQHDKLLRSCLSYEYLRVRQVATWRLRRP